MEGEMVQSLSEMIGAVRRFLGIEKFEMPREPMEFTLIRPVIESHISGDWCMGKTPERTAIVVQLNGKMPLLEQQLKELADYHGFEIEVQSLKQKVKNDE